MLRIAVPNKGSLAEPASQMLSEAGYRQRTDSRELVLVDAENDTEFFFLRPRDIAIYVGSGRLDVGITGEDLLLDSGASAEPILPLRLSLPCTPEMFAGLLPCPRSSYPSAKTTLLCFAFQLSSMTAASRAGTVTVTAPPAIFTASLPHLSSPVTNLPSSGFNEIVTGRVCRVGFVTHR